jgi:hypothetical protein
VDYTTFRQAVKHDGRKPDILKGGKKREAWTPMAQIRRFLSETVVQSGERDEPLAHEAYP